MVEDEVVVKPEFFEKPQDMPRARLLQMVDLARSSFRGLAHGRRGRLVDTGVVSTDAQDGVPFNNGLGVGFDAQVAEGVASAPRILGGVGGYLWSVGRLLIGFKYYGASLRLDGGEATESEPILLAVALGTTYGSTFRFAPEASLEDGLFNVVYSTLERSP